MVSSFFGLFTAQRALTASQTVMNVVSNNIANANTEGYSRQTANLTTSYAYPQPIVGTETLPGTFGTGVEIETITRTRDSFLDAQYRVENCTYGDYLQKQWAMENIEGILAEPSDSGIISKLDQFFTAAQDLSLNPESLSVRTSFIQQAVDLTVVLNQQASQLQELRETLVGNEGDLTSVEQSKLGMYIVDVNSKLESLTHVNSEIITLKGNGVEPNDLLDQRDSILDELSTLLPLTIVENTNGSVNVSLGANALVTGAVLENTLSVQNSGNINDPADVLLSGPPVVNVNADITSGICGGLLEMGGNDPSKTTVLDMIEELDLLASQVATEVNALQSSGRYIDSATGLLVDAAGAYDEIFTGGPPFTAATISVDQDLIDDPNRISAAAITAANDEIGSNTQALAIAQLRNVNLAALGNATISDYQAANVSKLGVQAKSIDDFVDSQGTLVNQIDLRRESVSGVNLDEELVDLIRFQRAFEASSRVMSTMNDILDVIINRMA
ncbi:MAG: flagellar hook-associated protein FlgK [Vampirovibrionia bacterium]